MNIEKQCRLCAAVEDSLNNETTSSVFNKKLYESASFLVLPCIGPLELGHVMIVSKEHHESLASMGIGAIQEAIKILEFIFQEKVIYNRALVTEHGAFLDQSGGACIVHTHIHVIPEQAEWVDILDDILPHIETNTIEDLHNVTDPYILTLDMNGTFRVYQSYNAHPQMVRKAICDRTNRSDSDWAKDEKKELVNKTVEFWIE